MLLCSLQILELGMIDVILHSELQLLLRSHAFFCPRSLNSRTMPSFHLALVTVTFLMHILCLHFLYTVPSLTYLNNSCQNDLGWPIVSLHQAVKHCSLVPPTATSLPGLGGDSPILHTLQQGAPLCFLLGLAYNQRVGKSTMPKSMYPQSLAQWTTEVSTFMGLSAFGKDGVSETR